MSSTSVKIVGASASDQPRPQEGPPPPAAYSNVVRIVPTPNEMILDFGLNLNAYGQVVEEEPRIVSRVITSYDGAKRLWVHLTQVLQAYEEKYGVIDLDIARRIKATASETDDTTAP